jgi:hypothetical protein
MKIKRLLVVSLATNIALLAMTAWLGIRLKNIPDFTQSPSLPTTLRQHPGTERSMNLLRSPSPAEIREVSTEEWFARIGEKEEQLGYARFASLHALIKKAAESDSVKDDIIRQASDIIADPGQDLFKRWQSCYVLSGIGDKRGIPVIKRALQDENSTVRGVAVCALGAFSDAEARGAIEDAAKSEMNSDVQKWIQKALAGEFKKRS